MKNRVQPTILPMLGGLPLNRELILSMIMAVVIFGYVIVAFDFLNVSVQLYRYQLPLALLAALLLGTITYMAWSRRQIFESRYRYFAERIAKIRIDVGLSPE